MRNSGLQSHLCRPLIREGRMGKLLRGNMDAKEEFRVVKQFCLHPVLGYLSTGWSAFCIQETCIVSSVHGSLYIYMMKNSTNLVNNLKYCSFRILNIKSLPRISIDQALQVYRYYVDIETFHKHDSAAGNTPPSGDGL
jgi:hypothetical protein